jgi:hypothetical protein
LLTSILLRTLLAGISSISSSLPVSGKVSPQNKTKDRHYGKCICKQNIQHI